MDERLEQWSDRYIAQWNESDPETRRVLIKELWTPDGVQVLVNPPQEIRDAARNLAFPIPPLEVRGHDALNGRISRAYDMFVAPGEHVFKAAGEATYLLPNVLALRWSMASVDTGEAVGGGLDVITLDDEGRIRTDHQFIGGS
ncbi:hypothetical protein [Actinomadura opuntiae]|uniref:hypothetical protein n=1 Tax=Actinomadura sp. OS1-43 TaxID=604315 RepID=UPI00255B2916|nr:hypothetical protein [Actinomadura sp. OS1-43]MDL4814497.1 hypothetical protein [Actinomadura sp. OS1-43]